MTELQADFGAKGTGYAGVDLYEGGKLTAEHMLAQGLQAKATKPWSTAFSARPSAASRKRGSPTRLRLPASKVDRLEITQEANSDASLAVPILAAYVQANPDLKAIGTQHGGITGILADTLQKAGKKPGDIIVGGIDLGPATIDGLKSGYTSRQRSTSFSICRASCRCCNAS